MEPLENFEKVIKRKDLLRFQDERGKKLNTRYQKVFHLKAKTAFQVLQ